MLIGRSIWGFYFSGLLDDMMIWDRALSTTEIQDMYNAVLSGSGTAVATKISAKGYNICDSTNGRTVEREIEINYQE